MITEEQDCRKGKSKMTELQWDFHRRLKYSSPLKIIIIKITLDADRTLCQQCKDYRTKCIQNNWIWFLLFQNLCLSSGSQSVVPGPPMTALFGNLSELQTPESCPRTINSETLEVGLAICVLTSPPDDSGVGSCFRAIALQAQIRVRDFC